MDQMSVTAPISTQASFCECVDLFMVEALSEHETNNNPANNAGIIKLRELITSIR